MSDRLAPLGIRFLTAHLDLRDTLAAPIARPLARAYRRRDGRATRLVTPLAVHRRADDLPLGRIEIERDARGPVAFHLSPTDFARSALASEALAALTHALPSRRTPRLGIETGRVDQPLSARTPSAAARRLAHYAPLEARDDRLLDELGVPVDYGASRGLARVREPAQLELLGPDYAGRPLWLAPGARRAFRRLAAAAAGDGVDLKPVSGFRSVGYQVALIRRKLAHGQPIDEVLKVLAAPGYSEHHSGAALDLTTADLPGADAAFEHTEAYRWLVARAAEFGFALSYPPDNPHGIAFEPWHWRWRG